MLHKVVAPFPCSWDGITSVDLEIGDERDFGSMADGLVAIGWIEELPVAAAKAVPDVSPAALFAAVQPVDKPPQKPQTARRQR